jgi:hypothetical protein
MSLWRGVVEDELGDGDEFVSACAERVYDRWERGDRLAAFSALKSDANHGVVHEDDRSGFGACERSLDDRAGAGSEVVVGVDVPEDHQHVQPVQDRERLVVE